MHCPYTALAKPNSRQSHNQYTVVLLTFKTLTNHSLIDARVDLHDFLHLTIFAP